MYIPDWITSRRVAPMAVFFVFNLSKTSLFKYFFNNEWQSLAAWSLANPASNLSNVAWSAIVGWSSVELSSKFKVCKSSSRTCNEHSVQIGSLFISVGGKSQWDACDEKESNLNRVRRRRRHDRYGIGKGRLDGDGRLTIECTMTPHYVLCQIILRIIVPMGEENRIWQQIVRS